MARNLGKGSERFRLTCALNDEGRGLERQNDAIGAHLERQSVLEQRSKRGVGGAKKLYQAGPNARIDGWRWTRYGNQQRSRCIEGPLREARFRRETCARRPLGESQRAPRASGWLRRDGS